MNLGQTQELHSYLYAVFVLHAYGLGYKIRSGDAFRDPRAFGVKGQRGPYGSDNSNHKDKLAHDANLFKDGKFLQETDDHRELGEFWESLHQWNRWGGRYDDGNHYETIHGGWR